MAGLPILTIALRTGARPGTVSIDPLLAHATAQGLLQAASLAPPRPTAADQNGDKVCRPFQSLMLGP